MGRQAETTSTTAEFLQMMVFKAQLGIGACTVVSIQTDSLVLQFRQFGETVSVGIPGRTVPILSIHISPHLIVRRDKGEVQGRIIIERTGTVEIGNGMRERTGITDRFLVMMFTVPAMAEEPNKAEPPPRTTSTRSIILAGICSSPYTPAKEEKMGRESINIWGIFSIQAVDAYL